MNCTITDVSSLNLWFCLLSKHFNDHSVQFSSVNVMNHNLLLGCSVVRNCNTDPLLTC